MESAMKRCTIVMVAAWSWGMVALLRGVAKARKPRAGSDTLVA
jgi:hypothetical protein